MGQGPCHAHVRQHGHIVRGGHRTHAAFGIGGQAQDVLAFAVGQSGQQTLAGGRVQVVEQVHALVGGHAFEQGHHGLAGQFPQQAALVLLRKIHEHVGQRPGLQAGQQAGRITALQALQGFGHVGGMNAFRQCGKGRGVVAGGQVAHSAQQVLADHGHSPFFFSVRDGDGSRRTAGAARRLAAIRGHGAGHGRGESRYASGGRNGSGPGHGRWRPGRPGGPAVVV